MFKNDIMDTYIYTYAEKKINIQHLSLYSQLLASKGETPKGFLYPSIKNFQCSIKKSTSPNGHRIYDYSALFSDINTAKHIKSIEYRLPTDANGIIRTIISKKYNFYCHFTSSFVSYNRGDGYIVATILYDFKVDNSHMASRGGDHAQNIVIYLNDFNLVQ